MSRLAMLLACGLTHVSGLLLTQRPVPHASYHRAPATLRVRSLWQEVPCRSRTIVAQASEVGMTLLEDRDQYDALIADATKENRAAAGSIQGHGSHCTARGPPGITDVSWATVSWAASGRATGLATQASW